MTIFAPNWSPQLKEASITNQESLMTFNNKPLNLNPALRICSIIMMMIQSLRVNRIPRLAIKKMNSKSKEAERTLCQRWREISLGKILWETFPKMSFKASTKTLMTSKIQKITLQMLSISVMKFKTLTTETICMEVLFRSLRQKHSQTKTLKRMINLKLQKSKLKQN